MVIYMESLEITPDRLKRMHDDNLAVLVATFGEENRPDIESIYRECREKHEPDARIKRFTPTFVARESYAQLCRKYGPKHLSHFIH